MLSLPNKAPNVCQAWMEFVEPTGSPYYYCFLTQTREYEFPPLVPTLQLGMSLIKTARDTHATRLHQCAAIPMLWD